MGYEHNQADAHGVSILTRPEGRVLDGFVFPRDNGEMFQSSPGPRAGCLGMSDSHADYYVKFQSSPGPRAGCLAF